MSKTIESVQNTETLICSVGNHSFERERTRGRKPSMCPKHKAEAEEALNATRKPRASRTTDENGNVQSSWPGPTEHELENVYPLVKDAMERKKLEYFDKGLRRPIWSKSMAEKGDDTDSMSFVIPSTHQTRSDYDDARKWRAEFLRSYARRAGQKTDKLND